MYARVSGKKKKLYDESDYEKFLKMEVNAISRKMGEGDYRMEIDELGAKYKGATLIENALNRNLANTYGKLIEVASSDAKPVIRTYLRKFDISNIKRILRWKKSDQSEDLERIINLLGTMNIDLDFVREKSFEEIIENIEFKDSKVDYGSKLREADSIEDIERILDDLYAKEIKKVAENSGSEEFRRLIEEEQFNDDLKLAVRMKKYDTERENIENRLFNYTDRLEEVLEAESFEEAFEEAKNITDIEAENLEEFEHALDQKRLEKALKALHREPLGLSSVIGYLVAKETEIENLRMIARAKETGIKNTETIKEKLVIA
jgi:V/A-type H+-transporting ATPase subunit C